MDIATLAASQAFTRKTAMNLTDVGSDVWLIAGQSNAAGYGLGLDATYFDFTNPRIRQYAGAGGAGYAGMDCLAVEPLFSHKQPSSNDRIGFSMTFFRELLRTMPANRNILAVPTAHGDTGFTTTGFVPPPSGYHANGAGDAGCWDPAATDGGLNLAAYAVAQANAAIALNPNNRLAGILWHQGEADGGFMTQAQYAAAMDRLIAYFRANITGATNALFLLGQMVPSYVPMTSQIPLAQVDTPRRNQYTAFVYGPASTSYVNATEAFHYNAAGQRIFGRSYYAALALAKANVVGTAPTVPTAVTVTQTSTTTAAVSWTRPVSRVTDYSVRYSTNGGTSWSALTRAQSIDLTATITGLTVGQTLTVQVAAVNETGMSAWSASGSAAIAAAPAQVTGLAAGTPAATSVPLTWTATSGATSYVVQQSPHGANTWTTVATPTTNSATVTGLAATTQYDFQVAAVNGAGTGTYSATVSATTINAAIIDTVGVAALRAYSTKLLRTAFAGKAMSVRRSSDNALADIGFTAAGDLDQTALLAHCGAGSGYVVTWYDQSGNGRDFTNATAAQQPKIVNAGTVITVGGKPAVQFDGTATNLQSAVAVAYANGSATACLVATNNNTGTAGIYSESQTAADSRWYIYQQSTGSSDLQIKNDAATALVDSAKAGTTGGIHQYTYLDTGAAATTAFDGTGSTVAYTRSTTTLTRSTLGARRDIAGTLSSWHLGYISELVIFAAALTGTQQTAAQAAQKAYFGTP